MYWSFLKATASLQELQIVSTVWNLVFSRRDKLLQKNWSPVKCCLLLFTYKEDVYRMLQVSLHHNTFLFRLVLRIQHITVSFVLCAIWHFINKTWKWGNLRHRMDLYNIRWALKSSLLYFWIAVSINVNVCTYCSLNIDLGQLWWLWRPYFRVLL